MATAITANKGSHVTPHVLRENKGAKKFAVHNTPNGKIQFNGTDQDWLNMHAAMIDVIQSGTGRGIKGGLSYSIAGKTGTAQVKSIAQGKRYNEAALSSRQWDHGLFVGFAPADNPQIAIAVVWENGKHGGSAAKLARPIFDYWLVKRKKEPLRPAHHQVSGGLMTAGIKPGELPSGNDTTALPNAASTPVVTTPAAIPPVQPAEDGVTE
jgi:penicillin-binding protein 2